MNFGPGTDRIPPAWNGWMSHTYDDVPTDDSVFVEHHYQKEWRKEHPTQGPDLHNTPGSINPFSDRESLRFREQQREKHHTNFRFGETQGFEGKKVITEKPTRLIEDPMENY